MVDLADRAHGATLGGSLTLADTDTRLEVVGFTADGRFGAIPTATVIYAQWVEVAAEIGDADPDEVEPAAVAVDAGGDAEALADGLNGPESPVRASSPASLAAQLPGVAGVRASFALLGVAGVAVAVVAATFALANVAHRQCTVALLRALGASRRRLLAALAAQRVLVTIAGAALAAGLVAAAAWLAPADVPLRWNAVTWAVSSLVALAATLLASAVAIVCLTRVAPSDAVGARR